ncbi:MAG TPA: AI-2E family transporter, partial [Nocardioides sp.]|nr:AI-2E family transporter [Nocardioides sp.]
MSNDADPPEPDPSAEPSTDETEPEAESPHEVEESRRRWPLRRHRGEDDESFAHRLAHQWAQIRDERHHEPQPIVAGRSNLSRAQVPWGLDLAAAWSWRVIVIAGAGYAILWLLAFFSVITLPLVVALLITALVSPLVNVMDRAGIPRGLAAITVVLAGLAAVAVLLTFVGQQVAGGASDLADSTVEGLGEIKQWLKDGPLNASDSQIDGYIEQIQDAITERSQDGEVLNQVSELGATLGHVLAGFFIVLFSTFFFLAEGERIWSWAVRIAPRAARQRVDSS